MKLFLESDIDYPYTVTVTRPQGTYTDEGDYTEDFETIIENMTADIQLSLKIRNLAVEDKTGVSDNTVWVMYCDPVEAIKAGDLVYDGSRVFVVDGVGEWGSHTECVMRIREE
ncbi:MAG: hypothetical protein JXB48_11960 [Candidatus Latescibacteria bacterium]|nr:hypothetical protein [Candidatus Latescibacterota bacterium]